MKKIIILAILSFISFGIEAQQNKIQWLSFEEAIELNEKNPKPILVDIYTDWCGWCKRMDKTTYSNKVIVDYVNTHYYPVKLNGEEKEDITFKGKTFTYKENGRRGYHELAASIMKGKMSYPTTIFLNEKIQLLQNVPGYVDAKKFEKIIAYFNEKHYKKTPWKEFEQNFKSAM
ncbi:DUF255 domain-containing protein [Tenacibaculum tangerinum]|uniref:DUF255 domain-containing protein n=1 Tax=Tenacibaculum tangerinum TaxID=3038772 RepID=A0ABY8L2P9_9FLAO|nr:DUF255 domain-containing protein [Tenacibaculum tangerinum]WGH75361.1 DUF255 domain-containing protein [Tenacibaculum tangerinum]